MSLTGQDAVKSAMLSPILQKGDNYSLIGEIFAQKLISNLTNFGLKIQKSEEDMEIEMRRWNA